MKTLLLLPESFLKKGFEILEEQFSRISETKRYCSSGLLEDVASL